VILPLDECRRILGPAAAGMSDDDLAVLVARLELFAEWSVDRVAPVRRRAQVPDVDPQQAA